MESLNFLMEVPKMLVSELEKILNILPNPKYIEVRLSGNYSNYSHLIKDLEGILPNIEISPVELRLEIKNINKDQILKLYKRNLEREKNFYKNIEKKILQEEKRIEMGSINLNEINWYEKNYKIKLSPYNLEINYQVEEPEIISNLKRALKEFNTKIELD